MIREDVPLLCPLPGSVLCDAQAQLVAVKPASPSAPIVEPIRAGWSKSEIIVNMRLSDHGLMSLTYLSTIPG